jgi:hypothetical protein
LRLTARGLNRATLARQRLLRREPASIAGAMAWCVALQAQEPPSPYLAIWNRVEGFDAAELDRAFETQDVVKAQLLRITLHAVAAADYPAFHEAMQVITLRAARLNDRRFRSEGVSVEDTDSLIPDLVAFAATPRVNADVEHWLEERFGAPKPRVWWALRQYGPFVHAVTGGAWAFGPRPSYVGALEQARPGDPEASVRHLVRRYLEGFGPATVQDIAQFSTILRPPIQAALTSMADELERHEGPDGVTLYDVPGGRLPAEDVEAPPRLLPMWDSALLAYRGRARLVPPHYRTVVMRNNGDVLPTVLVDGSVAGVWRPLDGRIEVTAFEPLPRGAWAGLEAEAEALATFLAQREPAIYRRYLHWWDGLPGDVRVL